MKAIDILCASQAATSIVDYMDSNQQPSSSSSSGTSAGGGRAIDRHNPIIQDEKRLTKSTLLPQLPTTPNKNKKIPKNIDPKRKSISFNDENSDQHLITNKNSYVKNPSSSTTTVVRKQGGALLGWGCTKPGDFISPASSTRFLLPDKALSDQYDPLLKQIPPPPPPPEKPEKVENDDSVKKKDGGQLPSSPPKTTPRSSSSLSSRSSDQQVVVLRVSLHCKGCEKKMRKHISKMEGVKDFSIDFMAKKVTVIGDITPLAVLTSISKVKNAKLLTPTTISTPAVTPVDSDFSEIKKQLGIAL